jgi:hypothetical protein
VRFPKVSQRSAGVAFGEVPILLASHPAERCSKSLSDENRTHLK